jgi:hypothetical protein
LDAYEGSVHRGELMMRGISWDACRMRVGDIQALATINCVQDLNQLGVRTVTSHLTRSHL